VPLTLDLIRERLVKNFYRSKVAVEYDIRSLVSNAELFFGDDSELTSKMNRLASDLLQLLQ
jgi:PH-interacting protein